MKTTLATLCVSLAAFCVNAVGPQARFVTPIDSQDPVQLRLDPKWRPGFGTNFWCVTSTLDSGPGSLREAISNAAAGDKIWFALRCPATIVLSNQLFITEDLKILGPGPERLTVMRYDGTNVPSFRLFNVRTGVVTIAGMTLRNGRALNISGDASNLGGAILNRGDLTVSNCVVTGNTAPTEFGGTGFGGGIFSSGPLRVVDSTISDNEASAAGGGIATFHSPLFVAERSTVSGNFAAIQGGGVNFQGLVGKIRNCTISGNSVTTDASASGLLSLCFGNEGAVLEVVSSTVVGNTGTTNGAVVLAALRGNLGETNRFLNTLVAANEGPNFFTVGNPALESLGHNFDSDGSSEFANGVNGDLVGKANAPLDARLSPLQDNGGPTLTHGLVPGSPALDAGSALDTDGTPLTVDQRRFVRPRGPAGDIGAIENQAPKVYCTGSRYFEMSSSRGAMGALRVIVFDPDGDALTVVWSLDGAPFRTNFVDATHPPAPVYLSANRILSKGVHVVSVLAWDGKAAPVECSAQIVVADHTPPKIQAIVASPSVLMPADGQLKPVKITVYATDVSGPVTSKIIAVRSNEPGTNGVPDWIITGDLTLQLRAETNRPGGRMYTITVSCSDTEGNTSKGFARVTVPGMPRGHNDPGGD